MKKNSRGTSDKTVVSHPPTDQKKVPNQVKNHLKPLVQKLLKKCTDVKVLNRTAEWEELAEIMDILQSIQDIEKNYSPSYPDRRQHWDEFYEWCSTNGCEFSAITVKEIQEGNFGAVANRDIKVDGPFLTIPRKVMMTEVTAKKSKLGPLIAKDPILQHMPNVQVSMHLLCEFLDANSFWKPYISILPSSYTTILYYNYKELEELQKSPALDDVFKILRSVIRQYCYFFQLFQNDSHAKSLNIGPYFTYDLYRWAVSSVMTRQNFLPSPDGKVQVTSLVPLFDMCNHTNGKLSTDFELEKDALVSYSSKSFKKSDEVCMFYGPRTNAEFLLHNGFVYPENSNDALKIKLGISKSDTLQALKKSVCSKLGITINDTFYLNQENINPELVQFLKILVMKSEELERALNEEDSPTSNSENSEDLERRALSYLKERVSLLLKSYPTTLQEDEEILKREIPESVHFYSSLQLRMCEKKILQSTFEHCAKQLL